MSIAKEIYKNLIAGNYRFESRLLMPVYGEVIVEYELIPTILGLKNVYLTSITCGYILVDSYVFQYTDWDLSTSKMKNSGWWALKAKRFINKKNNHE